MVADVPVGLFLSGGIDSSIVATLLARRAGVDLKTFTIGYGDSEFDEMPYAREVAARIGAKHTEQILSGDDALKVVESLPELCDEPIGDSSIIPTYLVSKVARRQVTVALSADGADELFGGYARYAVCGRFMRRRSPPLRALYVLSAGLIELLPPALVAGAYTWTRGRRGGYAGINDKLRKFVRMVRAGGAFETYEAAVSEWQPADAVRFLKAAGSAPAESRSTFGSVQGLIPEEEFMHFDTARYLPGDLLTKVDRASMRVSLEAREPFLDQELATFGVALPLEWKIRDGQNKYALRRILERYHPRELFDRPKKGFSVPLGQWLRGPLRELVFDELSERRIKDAGILDAGAVRAALDDFSRAGRRTSPAGLWFLLQLQQWAVRWLGGRSAPAGLAGVAGV
jgi:asparagine synthase (glutamine-hydrolysing)